MQNWDLADAILEELNSCGSDRVLFDDLRDRLPRFTDVPEEHWNAALKRLSDSGLADVGRIPAGFEGKWDAVVNAGISNKGQREVAQLRTVETYGDLKFRDWSEQLYSDLDRVGASLREEYAHKGALASSSYYRAAVKWVLERLQGFEDAFVTSYLRVVQERTTEGVSGLRERWLRRKIETTWKIEVERAKLNSSRLCQIAGVSSEVYAPQIADLEREAEALKDTIVRRLESAAVEQGLPIVGAGTPGRPKIELPAIQQQGLRSIQIGGSGGHPRAVILSALSVEYIAVRNHLASLREVIHQQGTVYEVGEFVARDGTPWQVAIVETGAGNSPATLEAERAIQYFEPDVALFVGIAGGLKDDVKLGDVVAATHVYGFESGKAELEFLPRPNVANSSYEMVQRARAEAKRKGWLERVGTLAKIDPKAVVKPIAAGEKVVADNRSAVCEFLRSSYGDAVAVEMEGRGFLEATHANPGIGCLVVRGVSDLIDGKADADRQGWQEIAARHAAAFAFEVLSNLKQYTEIRPGQFTIAEAQGPESSDSSRGHSSRGNATAGNTGGQTVSTVAPAFIAGIEAGVYGDGSIWAACDSLQGNTISPLGALLYISIFNQQSVPAIVKSYTVEFQSGEGNWVLLIQVPIDSVSLCLVQQGHLETANRIDFSNNLLEIKARRSAIPPSGILRGWAPFDVPETFVIPRPPVITYRIAVRGYNGAEGTITAAIEPDGGAITAKRGPFGRPSPESASFAINNRCTDLSSRQVLPFSRLMR